MKKNKLLLILFLILLIPNLWILLSGKLFLYPALYHNFADIDDYEIFHNRELKSLNPSPIPSNSEIKSINISPELEKLLVSLKTTALVVVHNDTFVYEKYWEDFDKNTISNSFSMTKSIVCILTGIALKEKLIDNLDMTIGTFLPSFQHTPKGNIRIRDLLTMSSGLEWDESYMDPFRNLFLDWK